MLTPRNIAILVIVVLVVLLGFNYLGGGSGSTDQPAAEATE